MAITIQQPWTNFVLAGIKTLDNRKWLCKYKGVLLIHAGKKFDKDWRKKFSSVAGLYQAESYLTKLSIGSFGLIQYPTGGVIGAVIMTGCDHINNNPWCFDGLHYYRFSDRVSFSETIKCPGQQRLFHPKITIQDFTEEDKQKLKDIEEISSKVYQFESL